MLNECRYKSQALQLARQLSVAKTNTGKECTSLVIGARHPVHMSSDALNLVAEENAAVVQVSYRSLTTPLLRQYTSFE